VVKHNNNILVGNDAIAVIIMPLTPYGRIKRSRKEQEKIILQSLYVCHTLFAKPGKCGTLVFFAESHPRHLRKNSNITVPWVMKNNEIRVACFFQYMHPFLTL
jgi:hypothetical protein